ncbi:FMN-binding protein [Alicyclobacillus sp. SO9]|uniref:FMN-binding protein n=1 Tax=Alicyclobacillus sp. SO9 TaxID=2665646 RepID=UPI0018E7A19A|nr:FMN-binding protein [Alicyclobacillus sp. SO9]QQE77561.1 FMN-binding protein [Alicyclobacillus sp. SO9]
MAGKMSPKFVTLCSLAVGAIYSTGYSITTNHNTAAAAPTVHAHASAPSATSGGQTNGSQSSGGNSSASSNTGSKKSSTGTSNSSNSGSQAGTQSSNTNKSGGQKSSSHGTKSANKKTNTTAPYLDGTYNGSASNRIGTVAVAVSIKAGKIANVQITQCDTHYPERYINPVLPSYVVAHQTTRIPIVSGATLSTRDFYFALVQALSQAKNPNYKG